MGELEMGYGLAGGGIGVYEYCPECGNITGKWPDPEYDGDVDRYPEESGDDESEHREDADPPAD